MRRRTRGFACSAGTLEPATGGRRFYAFAGSCVAVVMINFASALDVGISNATLSLALVIILLQIGYFAGLLASRRIEKIP